MTKILELDIPIRVRYQETDAMGVLHHANYFTYFEIGRTELLAPTAATIARSRKTACSWSS